MLECKETEIYKMQIVKSLQKVCITYLLIVNQIKIKTMKLNKFQEEQILHLSEKLVEYLYTDEFKDYEANPTEDHIFIYVEALDKLIKEINK